MKFQHSDTFSHCRGPCNYKLYYFCLFEKLFSSGKLNWTKQTGQNWNQELRTNWLTDLLSCPSFFAVSWNTALIFLRWTFFVDLCVVPCCSMFSIHQLVLDNERRIVSKFSILSRDGENECFQLFLKLARFFGSLSGDSWPHFHNFSTLIFVSLNWFFYWFVKVRIVRRVGVVHYVDLQNEIFVEVITKFSQPENDGSFYGLKKPFLYPNNWPRHNRT